MTPRRAGSRLQARRLLPPVLAALSLAAVPAAAQESVLEITAGPHETSFLKLQDLKVLVDGVPVPVEVGGAGADPSKVLCARRVRPGGHQLDVAVGFTGDSTAFSYVEGYVFRMRGQLQLDAGAGEVVAVQLKVVEQRGLTIQWTDRYRLALGTSHRALDAEALARAPATEPPVVEEPAVAAAAPAEPAAPAPVAVPASFTEELPAPTCALETPRFGVGMDELDEAARAALDRFAACLAKSRDLVIIQGFADPRGPKKYNDWLGERRAAAVAMYLVVRGVARERVTFRSMGASRFVCTEASEVCWSQNRRVEAITSRR